MPPRTTTSSILFSCDPESVPYAAHVYHIYAVRVPDREFVRRELAVRGVETGSTIRCPFIWCRVAGPRLRSRDFPCAECAAAEVLSLPCICMTGSHIERVCRELADACHSPRVQTK